MAGINKVILIGNLGKDPEVRALENGTKVARFTLATTETYRDRNTGERREQTEWHNIVVWRHLAELAEQYLQKGRQIYIEGKLQSRSYEDQSGQTRYITEVVAQTLTMLGNRPEGGQPSNSPMPAADTAVTTTPSTGTTDSDDLPF